MDSKVDLIILKNVWKDNLKIMATFLSFGLLFEIVEELERETQEGSYL